jgi:nicotinate-nucleotide adenylyltransferase
MNRIGLFGGTFDPVHFGHLIVARSAAELLGLERVIFLPSARPPHKPGEGVTEASHRAAMVRLAIEGEPGFEFHDYDLSRPGRTYTIETVQHIQSLFGRGSEMHWIIGSDSLAELGGWRRAAELVDLCRIITASRGGATVVGLDRLRNVLSEPQIEKLRRGILATPVIDISSTDVRRRVHEGKSIRFLVPESVRAYIEAQGLYQIAPGSDPT